MPLALKSVKPAETPSPGTKVSLLGLDNSAANDSETVNYTGAAISPPTGYTVYDSNATKAAANGASEPTTVSNDGWIAAIKGAITFTSSQSLPATSIASGNWSVTLNFGGTGLLGPTVSIGIRLWKVNADQTSATAISSWQYATGLTAANAALTIPAFNPGSVSFSASSPYLYVEMVVRVTTGGANLSANPITISAVSATIPAVSYARSLFETSTNILSTAQQLTADQQSFETSTAGYTVGAGVTAVRSTAQAKVGSASLLITLTGANGSASVTGPTITVAQGNSITWSGWVFAKNSVRPAGLQIVYSDQFGELISLRNNSVTEVVGQWAFTSITDMVPPTATSALLQFYSNSMLTNEAYYLDAMSFTINTVGASDVITRVTTTARTVSETDGTSAVDAITRTYNAARTVNDSVAAANDAVARQMVQARTVSETAGAASEARSRQMATARTVAESAGSASDSVTRLYNAARTVNEAVAAANDGIARTMQFNRLVSESVPASLDAITRAMATARLVAESVAAANDAITRTANFARTVNESVSSGGGGSTYIHTTYVFED